MSNRMSSAGTRAFVAITLLLAGCEEGPPPPTQADVDGSCDAILAATPLPAELEETSGVAVSHDHPGVFWTHNDSGWDPVVFAIDSTGAILTRVRVEGAANRDWEDIELAPCEPGLTRSCLFIAEIGDNAERYPRIAVYRIPEPDPRSDTVSSPATVLYATYEDGPRDAEALFVTDQGIHIVNKGRSHAIEIFRIPPPYQDSGTTVLRAVQQIAPPPTSISAHVTAAAASRDQRHVVLRTYGDLRLFRTVGDTLTPVGSPVDLLILDQRQGEAIDFLDHDRFIITSEGQAPHPPHLAVIRCRGLRDH